MNDIERLKVIEKAYQISKDWYYGEKITEEEYYDQIGTWKNLKPNEIIDKMCEFIQKL